MPTQVVTEYVRTVIKIDGQPIDGIRYRSSRRKGQTSLVLFADRDNVVLNPEERDEYYHFGQDRWLSLLKASAETVSLKDIAGWERSSGGLF